MIERQESNHHTENLNVKQQRRSPRAPSYIVAAGDPVIPLWGDVRLFQIDDKLDEKSRQFAVSGCSMMPKGIEDGDNLIAKTIEIEKDKDIEGLFLIIEVSDDYYNENEPPLYDYKLRCAIMYVGRQDNPDEIIKTLKTMDSQPGIWLQKNQDNLKEKLNKTRDKYPTEDLVLSCTYKFGELRYSFHKASAVKYVAETRIPWQNHDERISLN